MHGFNPFTIVLILTLSSRAQHRSNTTNMSTVRTRGGHKTTMDCEQAAINEKIVKENPAIRECNRRPRKRDAHRVDKNKVRNPLFTSTSVCLVCKYVHKRRRETLKYCRECNVEAFKNWPKTNRATGFAKKFHPRLCSRECFEYFHTHNIIGLDHGQKRKRKSRSKSSQICPPVQRARTSGVSEIQTNATVSSGSGGGPGHECKS